MFYRLFFLFICLFVLAFSSNAEKVHIAVSSNFSSTSKLLVKEFENISKHSVSLSFASSGKIFAQIKHGAPYDLFLSADSKKPMLLEKAGMTVQGSRFTYALGQLVLWTNKTNKDTDIKQKLLAGEFNKFAMANPKLAPYGLAAQQTLANLGLSESVSSKKVQGENIMQSFQYVNSGAVDLGFVAMSQVSYLNNIAGHNLWVIPEHFYDAIQQDVIWLKRAAQNTAAKDFMSFIRQPTAQNIIRKTGYKIPEVLKAGRS